MKEQDRISLSLSSHLCKVAKFQIPVSYPRAFPWIHHLHDDLQESRFTRPVLSHDTDPGLHGGGQINVGENNSKHFSIVRTKILSDNCHHLVSSLYL